MDYLNTKQVLEYAYSFLFQSFNRLTGTGDTINEYDS